MRASLWKKSFAGLAQLQLALAALLFLPAWTLRFWQAWLYWAVFGLSTLLITLHFLMRDPGLIERRLAAGPAAEKRPAQKWLQALASLSFVALMVVPALDHRFGWSRVPVPIVLLGDLLVAASFLAIFLVFRENSFASATVQLSAGQRVVSTGPYRLVRHPMYAAALLLFAGTPLALGSLVGLVVLAPLAAVLALRLLDEERLLLHELPGYGEYAQQVRWRLVPLVW